MRKNVEYTIVKGRLHYHDDSTEISFALVSEEDGLYAVEAFLVDGTFFKWGEAPEIPVFWVTGTTEKGYLIEITDLFLSRYTPHHNNKIEFISHGHVKLTQPEEAEADVPKRTEPRRARVWYVELEGLRIKHADYTRIHKERQTPHREHFDPTHFDHTSCAMMLNQFSDNGNAFSFDIIGGISGSPVLLEFTHASKSTLYWENYVKVRNNLVHFLSFLNGSKVAIRREYTGDVYRPSDLRPWSQVMYVHSFRRLATSGQSDFLPINYHHSYTRRVLQKAMFMCFDRYCTLEAEFDLNKTIDALHESCGTSIDEGFYILVTTFEKLSYRLALREPNPPPLMEDTVFNPIKEELMDVLTRNKGAINRLNGNAHATLASKIGNLNNERKDTVSRMHALLNHAHVPSSTEVKAFVETRRHASVHAGVVGKDGDEAYENYLKLDNMVRDILLNMLGYEGIRRRRIEYFSSAERIHKEES
ncbi:MAG: hypothetical protein IPP83_17440 [Flavobacteriales bacterium]|nr:hypothetical protein [Flavobacteriales bacterium]